VYKLVERYFKQDEHPFDSIRWEKRDALIAGDDGEPVFEQRGVELPASWSQQATNIVASKYFRVVNGVRESSVRDMIRRVAHTIATWGFADGYFSEEDARVFEWELAYILVNQYASFNSPVWFNVGVQENPQCSACFVLDVDDSMESILEWYRTEGMIFKHGSGAGVNVSKIRAKGAPLSGGGTASGPVSFMRGADTNAGIIKSGGGTRRAAKMVIMDVDHPDIEEFITCKVKAERMAQDLLTLGYGTGLEAEIQQTIPFQNANNSVSMPDSVMCIIDVCTDKESQKNLQYQKFQCIAAAAFQCGDPGLFFCDTVNKWHTTPGRGKIVSSNPCSEFVRPPNEACNLASINLLRFLEVDGTFSIAAFQHAVRVMITAQDILVDRSSYPTSLIARNSHDYRSLGLGYANLGALLMAKGLPYDSDEGRSYAGVITALMTAEAYCQSGNIARRLGAFAGYEADRDTMREVIGMHAKALRDYTKCEITCDLLTSARVRFAMAANDDYGYRNCQVTLIAPTGTISFMMDCDTTGVEPDTALIKNKKLVGGGSIRMVNGTTLRALETLGYDTVTCNRILVSLENTGSLLDSVHQGLLKKDDLKVFQTALGDNALSWQAHVKMVAAVQPFLSGAVSKTINMPADSNVNDVEHAFIMAWKLGLKSIAIYRDGSKSVQPVTTVQATTHRATYTPHEAELIREQVKRSAYLQSATGWTLPADVPTVEMPVPAELTHHSQVFTLPQFEEAIARQKLRLDAAQQPQRHRLPNERPAVNHKFVIGQHEGYLNVGLYPETGKPGELFIHMAKEGSTVSGLMDTVGILTSILLQYGVPLEVITNKLRHVRFEPSGFTGFEPVPFAQSPIDYVFRWLAYKYVDTGHDIATEIQAPLGGGIPSLDTPMCSDCGVQMTRRAGSCYICDSCGASSGCS